MTRRKSNYDDSEDGWCAHPTVFMDNGQMSSVLGPDGEPVQYARRNQAGFDLRPKQRGAK